MPGIEQEVHQIGREIQGLAARVGELEEKITAPPAATASAPLPAGANQPEAGPTRLQEVLPEVKELAGKVGGLEQLSEIVQTLKEAKRK
jgi:outer membrane murein-binding lipoprotein Lpp